jgi:hypothetical protein
MKNAKQRSLRLRQSYQVDNLSYFLEEDKMQACIVVDSEVEAIQLESDSESVHQRRKSPEKPPPEEEEDPAPNMDKIFGDLSAQYSIKMMVAKPVVQTPVEPVVEPEPPKELLDFNYYKEIMRKENQ